MDQTTPEEFCQERVNSYPFYSPRFWAGMGIGDYMRLLTRNRFRIHPIRIPMMFLVGGCAVASSGCALAQRLFMERKIRETELVKPPVFVVGHWRSGTTLLHEMFAMDEQFAWPSTFECFMPTHHLFSAPILNPLVRLLMPKQRPMDSMPMGASTPQEDEFALIGMGAPTPYYQIAFCNEEAQFLEMLNLKNASPDQIEALRQALVWFYKTITKRNPRQLVLKSPTHTGRIGHLAKWFPDARFVHIARNPHKVFPSTIHLWNSLAQVQGYQFPKDNRRLFEYVNRCYQEMYSGYFDQVDQIPADNLMEIKFEDLVQDPVKQMESVYGQFGLDGFENAKPKLQEFWKQRKSHRSNKTQLTDQTRSVIDEVWARYIERFGYGRCEAHV